MALDTTPTDTDTLQRLFDAQKAAFSHANLPSVAARRERLSRLEDLIRRHEDDICTAIAADYGTRSPMETRLTEIAVSIQEIRHMRQALPRLVKRHQKLALQPIPGQAWTQYVPKGVVGIISPWNYPFQLAMAPLAAALAAGNRVLIKPSELTPNMSACLKSMLAEIFPEDEVAVATGGPELGEAFSALPFDHLFFTGSTRVGRLVAMAAAKNLTPITLELGGKSPCVILDDVDEDHTARTIVLGKFLHAGQTCIAPDYLLVPRRTADRWAKAIARIIDVAYPGGAGHPEFSAMVSASHAARMADFVRDAEKGGAEIRRISDIDTSGNKIAPTLILNPPADSQVMGEEIFGPLLPILEYDSPEDALSFINDRDHPLALYAYARQSTDARAFLEKTTSGGAMINGTVLHFSVKGLPFGGVGKSGYGAYHGDRGFREFSHERGVFAPSRLVPADLFTRPWTRFFKWFVDKQIGS